MSAIGFERLPPSILDLLGEAVGNLAGAANDIGTAASDPAAAHRSIELREGVGGRIVQETVEAMRRNRRNAPDRAHIVALVQAIDEVVDELEVLAWTWSRCPLPAAAELLGVVRDNARDAARTVGPRAPQRRRRPVAGDARCQSEARLFSRRARVALLVESGEPGVALCGQRLLSRSDAVLRACADLRVIGQLQPVG